MTSAGDGPLSPDLLHNIDAWWRAAKLSVGRSISTATRSSGALDDRPNQARLLGHWGTTPGPISMGDMNGDQGARPERLYITGPGHGGPGIVANAYSKGRTARSTPDISEDEEG